MPGQRLLALFVIGLYPLPAPASEVGPIRELLGNRMAFKRSFGRSCDLMFYDDPLSDGVAEELVIKKTINT